MKKHLISLALFLCALVPMTAQDDIQQAAQAAAQALANAPQTQPEQAKVRYWTSSCEVSLGFNHTGLWSWAAGGYNNASLSAGLDAKASYKKDLASWDNRLHLDYGFLWSADKYNLLQKSKDRIYLESKWGYQTQKDSKWKYSASFDFRSQFSDNFSKYVQDGTGNWIGTLKSTLMSPAYANLAFGMDWDPAPWFNMNISPFTGGLVAVSYNKPSPNLRKDYGMPEMKDGSWAAFRFMFGAQVKSTAKWTVNDVFNFETQLVLFTDYLNEPYLRVNWDNKIKWKVGRFINLELSTWLIHDPIVMIKDDADIAQFPDGKARVQFKEFLELKFVYTIGGKK